MKIEHDEEKELFYFNMDGKKGELKYYLKEGVMDLVHTGVPAEIQGSGYGTELIQAALKYATEKGYKIIPSCPFVKAYVVENPSVQSLVARE